MTIFYRECEEDGESAFPGNGSALYSYQYKLKKLKNERMAPGINSLREELKLKELLS